MLQFVTQVVQRFLQYTQGDPRSVYRLSGEVLPGRREVGNLLAKELKAFFDSNNPISENEDLVIHFLPNPRDVATLIGLSPTETELLSDEAHSSSIYIAHKTSEPPVWEVIDISFQARHWKTRKSSLFCLGLQRKLAVDGRRLWEAATAFPNQLPIPVKISCILVLLNDAKQNHCLTTDAMIPVITNELKSLSHQVVIVKQHPLNPQDHGAVLNQLDVRGRGRRSGSNSGAPRGRGMKQEEDR